MDQGLKVKNQQQTLSYAHAPTKHSGYGVASIGISTLVLAHLVLILKHVEIFSMVSNEKQMRVSISASILAGLIAWRARQDRDRKRILGEIGLRLSVVALVAVVLIFPDEIINALKL